MLEVLVDKSFQNNITLILTAFISGVLSPIVLHWAKYFFDKRKKNKDDDILQYIHLNEQVDERVDQLQAEYNADRVWLAQFHNGGSFYPASLVHQKFQKFSVTFESCKSGISSESGQISNIPVSLFGSILKRLAENNYYGIQDIDSSSESIKSFWGDRNVKGFHLFAVKCLENKFLGILCVDFVGRPSTLSQRQIEALMIEARVLGGYISHIAQ